MLHRYFAYIVVTFFVLCGYSSAAWTPITGIPEPTFGVNDVAPTLPDPWTANTTGFYFVQTGGGNAGNGYPASPRGTMPTSPPSGSVIVVNGTFTAGPTINYMGTSGAPIFIKSYNESSKATITSKWIFQNAAYVIFDGINANWTGTGKFEIYTTHHLAIRNCDLNGDGIESGGVLLLDNGLTGYNQQHHIVVHNNILRNFGDWQTELDQDRHGVSSAANYTEDVWITRNTFYRLSGDGVQVGKNVYNSTTSTRRYFIGGNTAYEIKQNGFWSKGASDVIISSNTVHSMREGSLSGGGGLGGIQYGPENVWFINNTGYNNPSGISIGSRSGGVGENTYIVGNLLYDIHSTTRTNWDNPEIGDGSCVLNRGTPHLYVVNNTFADYDAGVQLGTNAITYLPVILSNIFYGRNASVAGWHILTYSGDGTLLEIKNNLIHDEVKTKIGNTSYATMGALEALLGSKGVGNINSPPNFVDAANNDFRLQLASSAIDSGIVANVFATFQTLYGMDIKKDIAGTTRPAGASWDIGAYEYTDGGPTPIKVRGFRVRAE